MTPTATTDLVDYWAFTAETPDLLAILKADVVILGPGGVIRPFDTASDTDIEQVVEDFKNWLAADSLDWDAVERGDAWDD